MEQEKAIKKVTELGNFVEYLKEHCGGKILSEEELEEMRKQYRREYQRQYYYVRKERENNLVVRLSRKESRLLKYYAEKHKAKGLHSFLKEIAFSYLENKYVPRDEKHLDEMTKQLNAIGNNVNQLVHRLHQLKYEGGASQELNGLHKGYKILLSQVEQLKNEVVTTLSSCPLDLRTALLEVIESSSDKIDELIAYLEKCKPENKE